MSGYSDPYESDESKNLWAHILKDEHGYFNDYIVQRD